MPATNHPDLAQTALFEQRGFAAIGVDTIAVQSGSGRWEVLAEWFAAEDFRGSLITNAAVELRARPEHPATRWWRPIAPGSNSSWSSWPRPAGRWIRRRLRSRSTCWWRAMVRAVSGQRATAAAGGRALMAALLAAGGEWAWE